MRAQRKKILIVQPSLQPPGGGNCVAAWMIEALRAEHALSVLTWTPIDLTCINRYFGTSLRASDFTALQPYRVWRPALDSFPMPLSLLKMNLLLRYAKRIGGDYELLMSVNNECDLGRPGIQYVHFPSAYLPRPASDRRWYHASTALLNAYRRWCLNVSDFSSERLKHNLTLVNSNWTAGKLSECYAIGSTTLYPPVPGEFPAVPWAEREDGFVCIGRFSPEKELEKVIDIIAAVRAGGRNVHLHLIGSREVAFGGYYAHIKRRAAENASWIFMHVDIARAELVDLVARHRYGIHGMAEEHFGMAVGEMLRGGCIVFVPRGGGQVEILDGDERLLYGAPEEAAAKIIQTLGDADRQQALRDFLEKRSVLFSTDQFVSRMREIVSQFSRGDEEARGSKEA